MALFATRADRDDVNAAGSRTSHSLLGEARKLLFKRLSELPANVCSARARARLQHVGVASVPATAPLFAMVDNLDRVGLWGGRSLAHCLWTFMLGLWRGTEVLLTPIGDTDARTPMAVGAVAQVTLSPDNPQAPFATVYAETVTSVVSRFRADCIDDAIPQLLPPVAEGCVRLYHASSVNAVTDIVEHGLDWDKCPDTSDFGKGFYMTPDIGCAVHFLITEAPPEPHRHPRALLAVDVDQGKLEALREVPELREGTDVWDAVTASSKVGGSGKRRSRELVRELEQAEVLRGPLTTRSDRRHLGPRDDASVVWQQTAFVRESALWYVDPLDFLNGAEETYVKAVNIVRLIEG